MTNAEIIKNLKNAHEEIFQATQELHAKAQALNETDVELNVLIGSRYTAMEYLRKAIYILEMNEVSK